MNSGSIEANIVDIEGTRTYYGRLKWRDGIISALTERGPEEPGRPYLLPGFIDAHVHIESSLLVPSEFARLAVRHGTVAAISDPHEIANVLGLDGVRFMLDDAARTPFHILFGAPSCVPATPFESAGASLDAAAIGTLLDHPQIGYLSEVMNFPGVLRGDPEMLARIDEAQRRGLPVDGHAPGVLGLDARRYAAAGISTDHECTNLREAQDKLAAGMHVLIREGSAARNFEALHPLLDAYPHRLMFCSDDKHPDDLAAGHIDRLVARAVALGHDRYKVLQVACINPIRHYKLPLGQLRLGDRFDAVVVADLTEFHPLQTWIDGQKVAEAGESLLPRLDVRHQNRFAARPIERHMLNIRADGPVRVIEVIDGELLTRAGEGTPLRIAGHLQPDPRQDLLLMLVLNRYQGAAPSLAFIRGFGLKRGAIASSVAHDSHNIVAVGADLDDLLSAVNTLVASQGGIALVAGEECAHLPLPVAGLMSDADGDQVARQYASLDRAARALGSPLRAPFMTLSFMALLVIPELKLSDRGLFDARQFGFVPLAVGG